MTALASLIFEDARAPETAGVHAVVIGCGSYRHLPGGRGQEMSNEMALELDHLSSAPHSARLVADWLFETYVDDPDLPLRSLHLLLAEEEDPARFAHLLVPEREVPEATLPNVTVAVTDWFVRGDKNPKNLLIFYFCGHGVSAGSQHALLCSDFGERFLNIFAGAIHFTDFHAGMDRCAARSQLYLIDACRVGASALIENEKFRGEPIVPGSTNLSGDRAAPIIQAAMPGSEAFGIDGEPSVFATALPQAFRGSAWRHEAGAWRVCVSTLVAGMIPFARRRARSFNLVKARISSENITELTLKTPEGKPMVPVEIACTPPELTARAELAYLRDNVVVARPAPDAMEWNVNLEAGLYNFRARFPGGGFKEAGLTESVGPPSHSPRIKIS